MTGIRRRAGPDISRERALIGKGAVVAGVDEVGRGALAGPLCVAAVVLDPDRVPEGVDDSKKLSPARREALFAAILATARAASIVFVPPDEIDQLNIRVATLTGMRRALEGLALRPTHALVDGRDRPDGAPCAVEAIVGGDALCASVAAASIVAKVMRDAAMRRLASLAPAYGFADHVGYGAPAHLEALRRHGRSPHHRRSFRIAALGET